MDRTAPFALVVDDDADQRWLTRGLLLRVGYGVEEAEDGREGLAVITTRAPLLLVLDLEMPLMGGVELLDRATREGLLRNTHVIVVSGASQVAVSNYRYRLPKPLPKETLVSLASTILAASLSKAAPPSVEQLERADKVIG